jgi:nitronate monooxygenase
MPAAWATSPPELQDADELRKAIRETRKLTDRPFMVGITILPSFHITMDDHRRNLTVCAEERVAGSTMS